MTNDLEDLLARYLQAVGQFLPLNRRADTLAELRANLLAQLDDQAEERGRPLTGPEVADLLKQHGRPVIVASRYLPQRSLIGPALFPFYWYTLKRAFPFVFLVYAVAQSSSIIFGEAASGGAIFAAMGAALLRFPSVALLFWAVVTLVFAGFEFAQTYTRSSASWKTDWNPAELPPIAVEKAPTLAHRIADALVHALFTLWLLAIPYKPSLVLGPGVGYVRSLPAALSPEWRIFYWQIVGLIMLQLALKIVAIFSNDARWQRGLSLTIQAVGVGVTIVLVQARAYFVPTPGSAFAGNIDSINAGINLGFKCVLVISVTKLLWDVSKLFRHIGPSSAMVLQ